MTRSVKKSKIQFQIGDCLLICNQFKKNNRSLQPLTSLFFRKKQRKLFIIPGKIINLLGNMSLKVRVFREMEELGIHLNEEYNVNRKLVKMRRFGKSISAN